MGSEHYCLRWNNHQSNLLGVFSQLLQDESLVDVTLACSEGASIRAHKVVLSACSSYFQSLFLDHPSRHPIVILKDVRFSELQTLVEFMYKGEVNVQYCQLSALLKTAESLKVKGLAEMTNQNTTLREPEREPDRLRPHSQPKPSSSEMPLESSSTPGPLATQSSSPSLSSVAASSIVTGTSSTILNTTLCLKRENDRCSPTSPKRLQVSSPTPLDLYQRKCPSSSNRERDQLEVARTPTNDEQPSPSDRHNSNSDDDAMSNDVGINMTINASSSLCGSGGVTGSSGSGVAGSLGGSRDVCVGSLGNLANIGTGSGSGSIGGAGSSSGPGTSSTSIQSIPQSVVVPPLNPSNTTPLQSDVIRPASRGCGLSSTITHTATSSGISSPIISTEPVAGPSGLGPVQSVPLSLKKEIEWDRNDDKSTGDTLDYRHSHDTEASEAPHGLGGVSSVPSIEQGGHIFPCMYCGATFPHQSKLTRHILSHSLETLKFRDTMHLLHPSQMASLLPHDIPPLAQQFTHRQPPPSLESLEPPDGGQMEIDFVTAAAAASSAGISGNSTGSLSSGSGCASGDPNSVVLCKFCGKSFPDVASLITHLPVHTGDRPFKCEFCGKAFKLRHHMKDHCRVHTGERPFRCSMCGKTFSRSTILKAHEKTHFPKYVRKFLSPSPVDTKDELPQ